MLKEKMLSSQNDQQTYFILYQTKRQALGDKIIVCQSALDASATEFGWRGQKNENKCCCLLTTFGSERFSVLSDSLFMD